MIKGWIRFNESSGNFTYEMAQEIIYYFSENSKPSKDIEKMLWEHPEMGTDADSFVAYESGPEDYEIMIKKLIGFTNTKSLTFKDDMIKLYHKIREERSAFPEIFELEDMFLDLIESSGFEFLVDTKIYSYTIRLNKENCSLSEFIQYCQYLDKSIKRLETPTTTPLLENCERQDSGQYGTRAWFKILLKKKYG
jgi:hypothetical protein